MATESHPPESRFAYVVVAARRARQLMSGAPAMVNAHSIKPTRVAMEELGNGVLEFDIPPAPVGPTEEELKRRRG
ncbi:MAG TPA: DNA-directed RNA polymerase subunit omega [Candidatus Acidoferrales bacterium]|nr:DNA-directed RNA polymerase subunit omega [Candidatus Acidoferrales bacterium]